MLLIHYRELTSRVLHCRRQLRGLSLVINDVMSHNPYHNSSTMTNCLIRTWHRTFTFVCQLSSGVSDLFRKAQEHPYSFNNSKNLLAFTRSKLMKILKHRVADFNRFNILNDVIRSSKKDIQNYLILFYDGQRCEQEVVGPLSFLTYIESILQKIKKE